MNLKMNTIYRRNIKLTWTKRHVLRRSTDYYQRLTLERWFTNLEQTPLNRSQQLLAPYKRLIDEIKQNSLRENEILHKHCFQFLLGPF